jgi:hypothetical protein
MNSLCPHCGHVREGFICAGIVAGCLCVAAIPSHEVCLDYSRKPVIVELFCSHPVADLPHAPHNDPHPSTPIRITVAAQSSTSSGTTTSFSVGTTLR